MTLSGRVDDLESQVAFIVQELLMKPSLESVSDLNRVWNQQLNNIVNIIGENEDTINELQILYANLALNLEGAIDEANASIVQHTFETVNQNLNQYPYTLYYSSGEELTGIRYSISATGYINKILQYNASGLLTHITLSGNVMTGISLNKVLLYTGDTMTGANYY